MSRPLRIQYKGCWYHVMNRGAARRKVFFTDKHRTFFLTLLEEISSIYGIEVHAYCLMDNHYHLIIHTPHGNLSEAIRHLNSCYTQYVNRSMKRDGALFRGRYKSIVVGAERYLLRLSRYIHLNPTETGLVTAKTLKRYKWSSFPAYIGTIETPKWLITKEVLKRFKKHKFTGDYKHYVETGSDKELTEFYESGKYQPVLGNDDERDAIFDYLKSKSLSAEIVGAKNIIVPPKINTIVAAVADHYHVNAKDIYHCRRRIKNSPRRVAILLSREVGGHSLQTIAKAMGDVSYTAISNTMVRTKQDPELIEQASKIKKRLIKSAKTLG